MRELREQLLGIIEKNSRIDLKELAVILGVEEVDVVNELAAFDPSFDTSKSAEEAAAHCVEIIRSFLTASGLPQHLSELGVRESDFEALAQSACEDAATPDNPREADENTIKQLYQSMYK